MTDILKDPALDFNGFFNQMRQALQSAQDKGKSGWDTCPAGNLYSGLRKALLEGRFVDAANYCLFLQRRANTGFQFVELEKLVTQHEKVSTQEDTIRLANVTIAQHEKTIRALREGDKYTGEDIAEIIANAERQGRIEGANAKAREMTEGLRKAGIKHGMYQSGFDQEIWEYGVLRARMGPLSEEKPRTAAEIDKMDAEEQERASQLRRENPMQGRRNDELLKEACGHGMSMSVVGEVAELVSPAKGYITVTRVGNEVTTTVEVDGTPDMVGAVMVQIAEALGNNEPAYGVQLDTSIDPAFGVDCGEMMSNSNRRSR